MPPRIYLAGFDVFRADALAHGEHLKALCRAQGLAGLFPLDNQAPHNLAPEATAQWICQQNLAMIRDCDALLANLNDFRGLEPDSGTAFEVGAAIALGKPVWVYFSGPASLRQQVPHDGAGRDAQGYLVEDFNLPRNLMLACTWSGRSVTVKSAIHDLGQWLNAGAQAR